MKPERSQEQPFRQTHSTLKRYRGVVKEIFDDTFIAVISGDEPGDHNLQAEFLKAEVSEDDLELLERGAWFYVTVERETLRGGRYRTSSSVRFTRLKKWAEDELPDTRERGTKQVPPTQHQEGER